MLICLLLIAASFLPASFYWLALRGGLMGGAASMVRAPGKYFLRHPQPGSKKGPTPGSVESSRDLEALLPPCRPCPTVTGGKSRRPFGCYRCSHQGVPHFDACWFAPVLAPVGTPSKHRCTYGRRELARVSGECTLSSTRWAFRAFVIFSSLRQREPEMAARSVTLR